MHRESLEAQIVQPDIVGRGATAAIFPPVDMETVQMLIAPGKQDLQNRMELRQSRPTAHQHPAPDERADAAQDDPQLVDAEWGSSGSHALRVAQSPTPLKGVPRYLTLSIIRECAPVGVAIIAECAPATGAVVAPGRLAYRAVTPKALAS